MVDGIAITAVGMLTVFVFLGILVAAMHLLRAVVLRFLPDAGGKLPAAVVAAVAAAVHEQRRRSRGDRITGDRGAP